MAQEPEVQRDLDEVYILGDVIGTSVSTNQDIVITNNESTNRVNLNSFLISNGAASVTDFYIDVDQPGTGTTVDPMNMSTHAQDTSVDVRYGNAIATPGTGTEMPFGTATGSSGGGPNQAPGIVDVGTLSIRLDPGESFMARWQPSSGQRLSFNGVISVFDPDRDIEDNPLDLE